MSVFKIQLMAYGEQDYFLTGNPQISYFKKVYRRHTHFSKETIDLPFIKDGFTTKFDSHFKANIPRMGELLSRLHLELDILGTCGSNSNYTVNNFTNSLIKHSQIKINEFVIEESLSQWRQIKHELKHKSKDHNNIRSSELYGGKITSLNLTSEGGTHYDGTSFIYSGPREFISNEARLGGFCPLIFDGKILTNDQWDADGTDAPVSVGGADGDLIHKKIIYDFDFWFTRNIGMALPVVCLFNNEIILEFDTEKELDLLGNLNALKIEKILLKGEYIHLYGDEKRRFTNSSHEYLIEQLQYKDKLTTTTSLEDPLPQQVVNVNSFNHPIKFLTWVIQNKGPQGQNAGAGPCYFVSMTKSNLYGEDGTEGDFTLELNGVESYRNSPMIYYTRYSPYKLCGIVPDLDRIGLYSFCLNPFENQPSGTCNMSKLRDTKLKFVFSNNNLETIRNKKLFIFAVNYNVFQINTNGMGGLLFI
tara:strand:- start:183 stop:1607 length:1425 start_codon:yes stop_codon:yes gene_type:complete